MGDFKSLTEIAEEMQQQEKPLPWQDEHGRNIRMPSVEEVNQETFRRRKLAQGQQAQEQEQPKEGTEQPQDHTEELGLSYPDVKIPLSNGEPAPVATVAATEKAAQSNGNGSQKPDWNTTGFPPIAEACGISNEQARRIMRGYRNPSVATLRKMSSFFGMSMDEIDARLQKVKSEFSPNQG